jgi:hypothetical protein
MKEKTKITLENTFLALVLAFCVFCFDYNRVTSCKNVATYYKCSNYLDHYLK